MMEFGIKIYGYDPLLSKEEIENFGAKTLSFSFSTGFLFSKKKKCVDVRGMFDEEEAKRKEKDFITKRFSLFQMI